MNEINLINETDLRVRHNDLIREAEQERLAHLAQEPRARRFDGLRCQITLWLARLNARTMPRPTASRPVNRRSTVECRARLDATGIRG